MFIASHATGSVPAEAAGAPSSRAAETLPDRLLKFGWLWAGLFALLIYLPALNYGFTLDDIGIVQHNTRIRRLDRPASYLATDWWNVGSDRSLYRPLTMGSFALEYAARKVDPRLFHFDNILLNAANAALVWVLANLLLECGEEGRRRARIAALAGALIFACHSLHVEAVAGIVGRCELMMTAGYLLGLIAALRSARSDPSGLRWRWGALAVLPAALLAAGSKEHGVTLPAAIALLAFEPFVWRGVASRTSVDASRATGKQSRSVNSAKPGRRAANRRLSNPGDGGARSILFDRIRLLAPAILCALAGATGYLALRRSTVGSLLMPAGFQAQSGLNPLVLLKGFARVRGDLTILARALGMLLLPLDPSPQYGYAHYTPENLASVSGAALHLALLTAGFACVWTIRRWPLIRSSIFLLMLTMLLSSNTVFTINTIFGERLLYLPSAAVALAVAGIAYGLSGDRQRLAGGLLLAIWLGVLLFLHARYLPEWRNERTIIAYAVKRVPDSVNILGIAAGDAAWAGDYGRAEALLDHLIKVDTHFPEAVKEVIALRDTIANRKARPGVSDPLKRFHMDLSEGIRISRERARYYTLFGNSARAEMILRQSLDRHPELTEPWVFLAEWLCEQGRLDEAETIYRKVCEMEPLDDECWTQLAYFFVKDRPDPEAAIAAAKKALDLYPGEPNALDVLNRAYALERERAAADGRMKTEIHAADTPAR